MTADFRQELINRYGNCVIKESTCERILEVIEKDHVIIPKGRLDGKEIYKILYDTCPNSPIAEILDCTEAIIKFFKQEDWE